MLEQKLVDVSDVLDMSTESREMGALGGLVSHTDHSGTDLSFNMIMSARSDVEKAHSDSMSNSFLGGRSTSSRSPEHAFAHFEVGRQMLEGDHDERSSLPYPVQHLRMSSGNTNRRSEEDLEVAHINRGIDDGAEEEFGASFNGQSLSQKEYNPLDNRKIRRHKRSKSESFILPIGLATPCQFLSQPAPINSARATFATPQNFNRFSIPDKDWGVSEPCCDEEILAIVCIYRPVGDEESAWTVPDAVSLCGNTNGCSIMEQAILSSLPPPSLTRHSSMPTLAGYEGRSRLSHSQSSKELHRGSKFYATFASPLRANPKIDEEDIDADVVLAVSDDVDQAAMLEKTAKKLKKKDVKWRRKSVADNKNKMDTSVDSNDNNFSPAYKGAVEADAIPGHDKIDSPAPQSKAPQRRHPKLSLLESISLHSRFEVSAVKPTSRIIDETNFKGVIIGGTYQHCFDLLSPVVAPPLSHEKRVVNVTLLEDRSLSIQLFIPSDREPQTVTLIRGWSCLRASPVGYLVSKSAMSTTRSIWYFIMRHPFGSPSSVATSSSRSMHSTFDSDADFETTEKAIRMLKLPAVEIDTTDDMQVTPYGQYEGEMSPDEDAERVLKGQSTHWDNSHVIAIAMSYLSENDRQSAQCVSKAWALASFKVVAQRKSCKDLTILDYSAWTKFIMQNGWGK